MSFGALAYDPLTGIAITPQEAEPGAPQTPSGRALDRITSSDLWKGMQVLTGTHPTEPRFQLWPERIVRSAATLPGDVYTGHEQLLPPGLRREDFTDIPAPSGPTEDSTRLGKFMGWAPGVAQTPNDEVYQRAQDLSGIAGGGLMFGSLARDPAIGLGRNMRVLGKRVGSGEPFPEQLIDQPARATEPYIPRGSSPLDRGAVEAKIDADLGRHANDSGLTSVSNTGRLLEDSATTGAPLSALERAPQGRLDYSFGRIAQPYNPLENAEALRTAAVERRNRGWSTGKAAAGHEFTRPAPVKGSWEDSVARARAAWEADKARITDKFEETVPPKNTNPYMTQDDLDFIASGKFFSDSATPGAPVAALENAPRFFSGLERAIETAPIQKGTGQQWLGTIEGKGGVKAEELDWTGLRQYLKENADKPLTREDIAAKAKEGQVQLGETHLGGVTNWDNVKPDAEALAKYKTEWDDLVAQRRKLMEKDEWLMNPEVDAIDLKLDAVHKKQIDETVARLGGINQPTKYHSYQLPGGENYREKLLTLPTANDRYIKFTDQMRAKYGDKPLAEMPMTEGELAYIDRQIEAYGDAGDDAYKSSHWPGVKNPVVHRRTNERAVEHALSPEDNAAIETRNATQGKIDAIREQMAPLIRDLRRKSGELELARDRSVHADFKAGKIGAGEMTRRLEQPLDKPEIKPLQDTLEQLRAQEDQLRSSLPAEPVRSKRSLHIEEIQSDWHQQGRKQGYKPGAAPKPEDIETKFIPPNAPPGHDPSVYPGYWESFDRRDGSMISRHAGRMTEEQVRAEALGDMAHRSRPGVPDAPFKKNWHELALKDAIREAAEKGFDRISWTPGEAQAARFDLSQHIKEIEWFRHDNGHYNLTIAPKNGEAIIKDGVTPKEMEGLIGKEATQKIVDEPGRKISHNGYNSTGILEGEGLKVGGEGMRGFYDKILPDALNKIGKAHGVKVQKGSTVGSVANYDLVQRSGGWRVIDRTTERGDYVGPVFKSGAAAEKWLKENGHATEPVHYMDIPPSLKEQALKKGFSLFEDSAPAGAPAAALEQGYTGPWYHGGLRMDRFTESGKINPKRATSGPMPYFTDDPEMASSYAMGKKADTSLADIEHNSQNFTVSPKQLGISGRAPMTVENSWHFLPAEKKAEIMEKARRIGHADLDRAEGPLMLHPEGTNAAGTSAQHFDELLRRERGNPLAALRDLWVDSGRMFDDPSQLTEVYRLAGYPHQISEANAPWTEARGVFPGMLRMRNPLRTDDVAVMTEKVLPALEKAFARDRTRAREYGADQWDKNRRTPRQWIEEAKADYAKGENSFAWTSIPDKVTAELRKLGYDGILDTGGKMGGQGHTVAIPFEPGQVRSTAAKFDPKKRGKSGLLLEDAAAAGAPISALQKKKLPGPVRGGRFGQMAYEQSEE